MSTKVWEDQAKHGELSVKAFSEEFDLDLEITENRKSWWKLF